MRSGVSLGDGGVACEAGQERVDHGIDSHQQGAHPINPSFVVGLGEAVHDFRAQEVGELMEGTLIEEAESGVWFGGTVGKFGGVFRVGLYVVRKEGAGKYGGSKGLS